MSDLNITADHITDVSLPSCSMLLETVFLYANLTSVYLPAVQSTEYSAFKYCFSLTSVDLPVCTFLSASTFARCTSLVSVSIPLCEQVRRGAFFTCESLESITLPVCSNISQTAFQDCITLNTITLGSNAVTYLQDSNAFQGTGITESTGSIYVPTSLLSDYQVADNWSYFATQIIGI